MFLLPGAAECPESFVATSINKTALLTVGKLVIN